MASARVVELFLWRWSLEVTFAEVRYDAESVPGDPAVSHKGEPRSAGDHSHAELSTHLTLRSNSGRNTGATAVHGGSVRFACRSTSDYPPMYPPKEERFSI
jgi:hypothetical protein